MIRRNFGPVFIAELSQPRHILRRSGVDSSLEVIPKLLCSGLGSDWAPPKDSFCVSDLFYIRCMLFLGLQIATLALSCRIKFEITFSLCKGEQCRFRSSKVDPNHGLYFTAGIFSCWYMVLLLLYRWLCVFFQQFKLHFVGPKNIFPVMLSMWLFRLRFIASSMDTTLLMLGVWLTHK